uniref:Putative peptidase n=1 Tax=viral metagenome TaxID=1070528 RepID=A0A6M3LAP6_9ZZZZ
MDWFLIQYFKREEFDSLDEPGSGDRMSPQFVMLLDRIRHNCGFLFQIKSGFRTFARNFEIGGEENSAHLRGLAADIYTPSSWHRDAILKHAYRYGVRRRGIAKTFIHLDIDETLPQDVTWLY